MSAGEASGDRLAALLVAELRAARPEWRVCGLGSEAMQRAGFELLLDVTATSAIGISESLRALPRACRALWRARRLLRRIRPDIFIAVDCQGLNLTLAKAARRTGARVAYFIPPQNFLWNDVRYGKKVAALTDLFLNIYERGHEFYRALGGNSVFCGHPLATQAQVRTQARKTSAAEKTVALAAGTRASEMRRFIPLLADCAKIIHNRVPGIRFITPVKGRAHSERMVKGFSRRGVAVEACTGEDVFARADAAVIKSGTMTLEAALALCPYTVFYRVSRVSFFIMARLWGAAKEIRFVSLPNILSGKELAREFIQREAKAEALAEEALRLIEDEAEAARQRAALSAFRQTMGAGNASARASEALCEFAANIQNRKENI